MGTVTSSSSETGQGLQRGRKIGRKVAFVVLAVLMVFVVWQNWGQVETPVLFMTVSMSRGLLMLLILAAGFVLGQLAPQVLKSHEATIDSP